MNQTVKPPATTDNVMPTMIEYLDPNPYQVRVINVATIDPLVQSIQRYGFIGSLEARKNPDNPMGAFQLVFGHRRLRAAELAGLNAIPIKIVDRTDAQMRELAYIENGAVEPLSYWDEAKHFEQLSKAGMSFTQIAETIGKSKGYVQARLDVLRLPEGPIRDAAQSGQVEMTVCSMLLTMPEKERDELFQSVLAGELTATDLRRIRKNLNNSVVPGMRSEQNTTIHTVPVELKVVETLTDWKMPQADFEALINTDEHVPGPDPDEMINRIGTLQSTLFSKRTPEQWNERLLIQLRGVAATMRENVEHADLLLMDADQMAEYSDLSNQIKTMLV